MKYVDEFRDPQKAHLWVEKIQQMQPQIGATRQHPLPLMEFCGGHTHTIFRYGLEQILPDWIELIHGPGCPVCVLPRSRVDDAINIAERPEVIFTTFGDAMRVPGTAKSLLQAKADGADVRMVYSPLDALQLARKHPERQVVFFALGFETTMPSTALTVIQAKQNQIENFSLLCSHITTVPTLETILNDRDLPIAGFLAPGHVSMVVGEQPFEFVAQEHQRALVITGFEPLDILQSIWMLLQQIANKTFSVENQYKRVVNKNGNPAGLQAIAEVFQLQSQTARDDDAGNNPAAVKMRSDYASFDAEQKFQLAAGPVTNSNTLPQCQAVLRGASKPWQCPDFGSQCTPEQPLGALMVSSEGACAAYYQFGDLQELLQRRQQKALQQ